MLSPPSLGVALGADGSFYFDNWGVRHFAAEPSVRWPLPGGGHVRLWYRFSDQAAADYFDPAPAVSAEYLTQDSDLGDFHMNSGGVAVGFPFRSGPSAWEWRATAFGYRRADDVRAVAVDAGVVRTW